MKFPSANGYFNTRCGLEQTQGTRSRFSRFIRQTCQANGLLERDEMKVRKMHSPRHRELLSKFQLPGQRLVTAGVCDMEIIQQPPALAHHFQQAPSGTVVLEVFLKVLGQMVD